MSGTQIMMRPGVYDVGMLEVRPATLKVKRTLSKRNQPEHLSRQDWYSAQATPVRAPNG